MGKKIRNDTTSTKTELKHTKTKTSKRIPSAILKKKYNLILNEDDNIVSTPFSRFNTKDYALMMEEWNIRRRPVNSVTTKEEGEISY